MKRYKVLKEYVHPRTLELIKAGYEFSLETEQTYSYMDALEREGFVEEVPEHPKTVDDLKDGDECWMLDWYLEPLKIEWRGTPYDIRLRKLGKIYLTKEELEKQTAWEEAKQTLLRDAKGFEPNWRDTEQYKYYVSYYVCADRLEACITNCYRNSYLYFATREDAEASIKAHPEEWKTYLGVEMKMEK